MTILVVGASGATGTQLVEQLLNQGHCVKAIVRSVINLPEFMKNNDRVTIIHASLLNLTDSEMAHHVKDCGAVASCLGHNMTWKGMFGQPRRLVTEATSQLCEAVIANNVQHPVKFVLMNSSGNSNRDLNESTSFAHKIIIGLLRLLVPPHVDNEQAADYLRTSIGQNNESVEWAAVRPVNLINANSDTEYEVHPSPIRSAIFDGSEVSRINVSHFMAELINNDELWNHWKGQMPVIYNLVGNKQNH